MIPWFDEEKGKRLLYFNCNDFLYLNHNCYNANHNRYLLLKNHATKMKVVIAAIILHSATKYKMS